MLLSYFILECSFFLSNYVEEAASEGGDRIKTRMSAGEMLVGRGSTFEMDPLMVLLLCLAGSSKYNGREQRNLKVIYFLTGLVGGLVNYIHPGQKASRRVVGWPNT